MSKNEFLKELRDYLSGSVSAAEAEDSIKYYENYINDQVKGGQAEADVVASLGDPRMIGRSIVDAAGRRRASSKDRAASGSGENGAGSFGKKAGSSRLKLYGIIALVILVILVVLIAITKVIAFFFPLIVVIVVLTMIFRRTGGPR